MKTHKDLESFNNWSKIEKNQFSISVIKGLVMDATRQANSGHPGGPMSCADFAYVLYQDHLNFDPNNPNWFNRDRFILSPSSCHPRHKEPASSAIFNNVCQTTSD